MLLSKYTIKNFAMKETNDKNMSSDFIESWKPFSEIIADKLNHEIV